MKIFAKRLRDERILAGKTQKEMAELLKIRQQSYAQYENDVSEPSLTTLVKIAGIFGVSSDFLLGLSDY